MITEDHVSFGIAKLLKEKGFDDTCRAFWKDWNGELHLCDCSSRHVFEFCRNSMLEDYNDKEETNIAAPTLQMAMKWLREVHSLYLDIVTSFSQDGICYTFSCSNTMDLIQGTKGTSYHEYQTYEQACEAGIKYCLTNLV